MYSMVRSIQQFLNNIQSPFHIEWDDYGWYGSRDFPTRDCVPISRTAKDCEIRGKKNHKYLCVLSRACKNVSSQVSIIPTQLSSKLSKIGPMPRFGFMKWINQSLLFKLLFILHAKLILERHHHVMCHPRDSWIFMTTGIFRRR